MRETDEQRDRRWTAYHDALEACRKRRLRRWRRIRRIMQALRWVEREQAYRKRWTNTGPYGWNGPSNTSWRPYGER